jgi:hypothetical protein
MLGFNEVMEQEVALIKNELDQAHAATKNCDNLTGLAFSGGGIRSATFNLGVIQSLASKQLLNKFDYLSTVSGGSYIGSWLSAQIRRCKTSAQGTPPQRQVEAFQQELNSTHKSGQEHDAIKWLRSYSNYLTPRKGYSGDTLAAVGSWLRNTLLNQITLILFFASLLLLPQVVTPASASDTIWISPRLFWLMLSILFTCSAIFICVKQLPRLRCCINTHCPILPRQQTVKLTLAIVPIAIFAAYSLSMWMYTTSKLPNFWMQEHEFDNQIHLGLFKQIMMDLPLLSNDTQLSSPLLTAIETYWSPIFISTLWALVYTLPWLIATPLTLLSKKYIRCKVCLKTGNVGAPNPDDTVLHAVERSTSTPKQFIFGALPTALAAGAFGGWLIYLLSHVVARQDETIRLWWATGFGTPLILLIFCIILMLHQGLMARLFRVSQHEWWARLGGYVMLYATLWAGAYALLIYIPPLLNRLEAQFIAAGGFVWAAHSLLGILIGKGAGGYGGKSGPWKMVLEFITERLGRSAPYMFVLGYLVMTSWVVHALTYKLATDGSVSHLNLHLPEGHAIPDFEFYLKHALTINNSPDVIALGGILFAGCILFLIFAWRIDVNLFSIHHFYRNRLTRCYLGAGRGKQRAPDRFTGFDPCDDLNIADLKQRPLHLINTALNLVHNGDLAWQDRKAYSFTFSPIACGFEYPLNANKQGGGYCKTEQYMKGALLGTALAASGAAASPNMGYHSSPAVAFLMTVFNARLGHWCPNPEAQPKWWGNPLECDSPPMGGEYLLKELLCQTDDKNDFIYLSDGGHFENLGVYELIRRQCRYIMVIDAGEDEERTFEDMGNLIRKCHIDFGVTINLKLDKLRADAGPLTTCFALGDIVYPPFLDQRDLLGSTNGVLLYIKPSLIEDLPEDIRQYAKFNPQFPHQATSDQFFDEAQFESYRHLGKFLMDHVYESVGKQTTPSGKIWSWD